MKHIQFTDRPAAEHDLALCGTRLDRRSLMRRVIEDATPGAHCPRCIEVLVDKCEHAIATVRMLHERLGQLGRVALSHYDDLTLIHDEDDDEDW